MTFSQVTEEGAHSPTSQVLTVSHSSMSFRPFGHLIALLSICPEGQHGGPPSTYPIYMENKNARKGSFVGHQVLDKRKVFTLMGMKSSK